MNLEHMPQETPHNATAEGMHADIENNKEPAWAQATSRYNELKEALGETEEILFRERPPRSPEEEVLAELELERDGLLGEAETYAQQNNPEGERAMRMLAEFKQAEHKLLCIYLDAKAAKPEFAEVLLQEHPWLKEKVTESSNNDLPDTASLQ